MNGTDNWSFKVNTATGDATFAGDIIGSASTQIKSNGTGWPTSVIGSSSGRHIFNGVTPIIVGFNEATPAANNAFDLYLGAKTGAGATWIGGGRIAGGTENAVNGLGFLKFYVSTSGSGFGGLAALTLDSSKNATFAGKGVFNADVQVKDTLNVHNSSGLSKAELNGLSTGGFMGVRNTAGTMVAYLDGRDAAPNKLGVIGNVNVTGTITGTETTATSDETDKIKKGIITYDDALNSCRGLQAYRHSWIDPTSPQGVFDAFMAQDVRCTMPWLVNEDEKGKLSLNYQKLGVRTFVIALGNADRLDQLERENIALKTRLEKVEKLVLGGK